MISFIFTERICMSLYVHAAWQRVFVKLTFTPPPGVGGWTVPSRVVFLVFRRTNQTVGPPTFALSRGHHWGCQLIRSWKIPLSQEANKKSINIGFMPYIGQGPKEKPSREKILYGGTLWTHRSIPDLSSGVMDRWAQSSASKSAGQKGEKEPCQYPVRICKTAPSTKLSPWVRPRCF
jgi:hypothetical protein